MLGTEFRNSFKNSSDGKISAELKFDFELFCIITICASHRFSIGFPCGVSIALNDGVYFHLRVCVRWVSQSQMKFMLNPFFLLYCMPCNCILQMDFWLDYISFFFLHSLACRAVCCCCYCHWRCLEWISSGKITVVGVSGTQIQHWNCSRCEWRAHFEFIVHSTSICFPDCTSRRTNRCFSYLLANTFELSHSIKSYICVHSHSHRANFFFTVFVCSFVVAAAAGAVATSAAVY